MYIYIYAYVYVYVYMWRECMNMDGTIASSALEIAQEHFICFLKHIGIVYLVLLAYMGHVAGQRCGFNQVTLLLDGCYQPIPRDSHSFPIQISVSSCAYPILEPGGLSMNLKGCRRIIYTCIL